MRWLFSLLFLLSLLLGSSLAFAGDQRFRSEHHAALYQLVHEPVSPRWDRDRKTRMPVFDSPNWRRVRFSKIEHFTGFKQKQGAGYLAGFTFETSTKNPTSAQCLTEFEGMQAKTIARYKIQHTPFETGKTRWKKQNLFTRKADGYVRVLFSKYKFSAAWAAYPAYENGCFIYAFVSLWKKEPKLAKQARDRFLEQLGSVQTRGKLTPHREKR